MSWRRPSPTGRRQFGSSAPILPGRAPAIRRPTTVPTTLASGPMKKLCLFYGHPQRINGLNDPLAAAEVYANYDILVFTGSLADPEHSSYAATIQVINRVKQLKTTIEIFGYIAAGNLGPDGEPDSNLTIQQITDRATIWKDMGATGVFLDEFGYDYKTSRSRQNEIIGICRGLELKMIVNAWKPDYVFSNQNEYLDWIDFNGNPDGLPCLLGPDDYYLFENHCYRSDIEAGYQIVYDVERVHQAIYYRYEPQTEYAGKSYYEQYGTKTIALNGMIQPNQRIYSESYLVAVASGVHAHGVSGSTWSDQNYSHYNPPITDATQEDVMAPQNITYDGVSILRFTTQVGDHTINIRWDQNALVKKYDEFPQTRYSLTATFSGLLNVDSSIEVQLNRVYYYPSLALGDTPEAVAAKLAGFDYGTDWYVDNSGPTVTWTWRGEGNPPYWREGSGSGTDDGNDLYINPSKGLSYVVEVATVSSKIVRRITLDGQFLNSTSGPSGLQPYEPEIGTSYYDTTLNKLVTWDGTAYRDGDGNDVYPGLEPLPQYPPHPDPDPIPAGFPVQGIRMWYDATEMYRNHTRDYAIVGDWPNKVEGPSVVQASNSNKPLFRTNQLNGRPVLVFDGTSDYLELTSQQTMFDNAPAISMFIVAKYEPSALIEPAMYISLIDSTSTPVASLRKSGTNKYEMSGKRTSAQGTSTLSSTIDATNAYIIHTGIFDYPNNQWRQYVNNSPQGTLTAPGIGDILAGSRYVRVGRRSTEYFKGAIAEIIIYDRTVTEDERVAITGYLSTKWGITI